MAQRQSNRYCQYIDKWPAGSNNIKLSNHIRGEITTDNTKMTEIFSHVSQLNRKKG